MKGEIYTCVKSCWSKAINSCVKGKGDPKLGPDSQMSKVTPQSMWVPLWDLKKNPEDLCLCQ